MNFRIADTFTSSLARLSNNEQRETKITVYELQANLVNQGASLHRIDQSRDKRFWSARVTSDIRIIIHRSDTDFLLCYVDHHDKAYEWARRRKIEVHPQTGAAQLIEVREIVQEVIVQQHVVAARPLFAKHSEQELLGYGVPSEWLADVRALTDEDSLLLLVDHLPDEAGEALLTLATGGKPASMQLVTAGAANPFDHPDALRRFRLMQDQEELRQALEAPWETWVVFLHPEQRKQATRHFNGPARISGSAGTGKTVLALHRAVELARQHPDSRLLLTTVSRPLAKLLQAKLKLLVIEKHEPTLIERIDVYALNDVAERFYRLQISPPNIVPRDRIVSLIRSAIDMYGSSLSAAFLHDEWDDVIDAWGIESWEVYRTAPRLGRKSRISEAQRKQVWQILGAVQLTIMQDNQCTYAGMFHRLAQEGRLPYDFVIVDEAQDVGVAQMRFIASIAAQRENGLFFVGDLGQRIFQQPFSWKNFGVDVRGRSHTLKVNYRTSHQIRQQADKLLPTSMQDYDGNEESRKHTVSVFNGPDPSIEVFGTIEDEQRAVAARIDQFVGLGIQAHEIGVFVRSEGQLARAQAAVALSSLQFDLLDQELEIKEGFVAISTMHLAKGLEFRAVVVMACDDDVLPLQSRIESATDQSDLDEVHITERHLLYVACTRARDHLMISGVDPVSDYVVDLI